MASLCSNRRAISLTSAGRVLMARATTIRLNTLLVDLTEDPRLGEQARGDAEVCYVDELTGSFTPGEVRDERRSQQSPECASERPAQEVRPESSADEEHENPHTDALDGVAEHESSQDGRAGDGTTLSVDGRRALVSLTRDPSG